MKVPGKIVLSIVSFCMLIPTSTIGGKKSSPKNSRITNPEEINPNQKLPALFKTTESILYTSCDDFWQEYEPKENELLLSISTFSDPDNFKDQLTHLWEFAAGYEKSRDVAAKATDATKQAMKKSIEVAYKLAKLRHTDAATLLGLARTNCPSIEEDVQRIFNTCQLDFKRVIIMKKHLEEQFPNLIEIKEGK